MHCTGFVHPIYDAPLISREFAEKLSEHQIARCLRRYDAPDTAAVRPDRGQRARI